MFSYSQMSDTAWLKKLKVKCPFKAENKDSKQTFKYMKPNKISAVGSWSLGLASKGSKIDLLVEIPREFWERDDHLNYRYHYKRALYLSYLAGHLKTSSSLVADLQFEAFNGDFSRPILVVQPVGYLSERISFRIFAAASADFVALEKLLPNQNCCPSKGAKPADGQPTPLYNAGVLADMRMAKINQYAADVLSTTPNVLNAGLLLQIWHRHRQLEGAFDMFILTQFLVYLVDSKKLFPNMSIYQVLRTVWLQLSRSDWITEGISLRQQSGSGPWSVADAHGSFPVVFLDSTSTLNYCARVTRSAYEWLRWESTLAVGLLNNKSVNSFSTLFMIPKPFVLAFENVVIFNDVQPEKGQHHWPVGVAESIHQCLAKGLGERLKLTACKPISGTPWPVTEEAPRNRGGRLAFGFCFNAPAAWEVMDKGPAADSPESADFRAFWGEKSQLRRFQDGFVCEAVHWPAKNWAQRRLICREIITFLIEKRLKLGSNYVYVADQLDDVLAIPKLEDADSYGTGEEATLIALEALDGLTKQLRNLDDLTLPISQVQGVAATFRHAEPFPPLPQIPQGSHKLFGRQGDNLLPTAELTPMYLPSLSVLLTLQTSGKWPDDLEAVRRIKAAFYIQLADKLRHHYNLVARAFVDHAIVESGGFIFKLIIAYQRDATLLKRIVEPSGLVKYRDNAASIQLEREQVIAPRLGSALRALQTEQPAFSTAVRMAKRWMSSHMLLDYLEEEAMELIVASLFVNSTMYGLPSATTPAADTTGSHRAVDWVGPLSPQVAFLRFLQLVASYDWSTQALVINFNSGLSAEELRNAESSVTTLNPRPTLVLITPYDPSGIAFTRHNKPPLPVWSRLMVLARESLKLLERQLMFEPDHENVDVCQAFRPPLDSYDAVIHLRKGSIARRLYTLDARSDKKLKPFGADQRSRKTLPVYDYEPVDRLLKELTAAYGDKARFFYDRYGGPLIGVMWIDKAWSGPTEFKVSHVNGCALVAPGTTGGEKQLAPNLEAICQDFLIMGRGLVSSVHSGSLVWQD